MTQTLTRAQIEAVYEAWMKGDAFEGPTRGFMARVDAMLGTGQRPLRAVLRDILSGTEGIHAALRDEAEALLARAADDESLRVATLKAGAQATIDGLRQKTQADFERLAQAYAEQTRLASALHARTAERDLKDAAIVDVYRQVGTVLSVLELKSEPSTDERAEIAMLQRWRQRLLAAWPTEPAP